MVKRTLSEPRGAATLLAGFRLNDPNDGAVVANLDTGQPCPGAVVFGREQKGGTIHVVGLEL